MKTTTLVHAIGLWASLFVATVILVRPAHADSGWTAPFSDETYGQACPFTNERVTGTRCEGSYCDSITLLCQSWPGGVYSGFFWTGYTSDEDSGRFCGAATVITGMDCWGDYCDNVILECGRMPEGGSLTMCDYTDWISEENNDGFNMFNSTSPQKAANGVQCSGDYCDAMRYLVCEQH
jgi:hypothetical protein